MPLVIASARIIHLFSSGYIIPDESNYASMSILWHKTGKILIDQGRELYQYFLLFFSIIFGLKNIYAMVNFMTLLNSLFASCSLWICNKILKKLYPDFQDRWFILLLFFLSPMYVILMVLGITELVSIFLVISSIYVYYYEKSSILFGLLLGIAYNLREPFGLLILFFFIEFIYRKNWKNLLKYSIGFFPFFYFPYNILKRFKLKPSLTIGITRSLLQSKIQQDFRYVVPSYFKTFPSLPNFLINNLFCITIASLFSIGLISSILIIISFYRKKINKWQILSIGLMFLTSIYISRFDAYSYNRLNKIGTIARLSIVSVFSIIFLPGLIKSYKNIKRLALISILVTGALSIPFLGYAQTNLSKNYVNRISLNYKAPWLISQNVLLNYKNNNSLVFCEPMSKIRFFKVENITYVQLPHDEVEAFNLIEKFDCVFLYLEIHHYFGLIHNYDWLYPYLQKDSFPFEYENTEFMLIRMV